MKTFRRLCGALAIACSTAFAGSAAVAQQLADAVEQAWSRHASAASLDWRDAEARARAEIAAGATPGPPEASLSALSDRMNRDRGARKWEMELGVALWLPGQRAARQAQADSMIDEVAAQRAALRLSVAGEVRARWWALAAARNAHELSLRRAATARALESDVMRRFEAGDLARIDANLARNERLAAQAEAIDAEALVQREEANYRALTGVAAPAVLMVEDRASPPVSDESHPFLLAAMAAARRAQAALLASAKSDRDAPKVAVRMERDRSDAGEPFSNAVGLRLTIPFSSGARMRQQTAAALGETSRAEAELALTRSRLAIEIDRASAAIDATQRQLEIAQRRRELTADNLQLAEKSFALGETDLTTLLRVRAAALEADALLSRHRVALDAARSQLNQSRGVLP